MRRAYVVVGVNQNDVPEVWYAIAHSMRRADELCSEANMIDKTRDRIYIWYEVIEEDD